MCLLSTLMSFGQKVTPTFEEKEMQLQTDSGILYGTLTLPAKPTNKTLALIIAGSGPTDRDGNNPMAKCEAYKKLAFALAEKGIASFRYDKRGIGQSAPSMKSEADIRFDQYVDDAKAWIDYLRKESGYSEISVIGHSEGSLIGMIASTKADKFISVAGAGQSADKILKTQLASQPKGVLDMCTPIIDELAQGKTVENVNPMLYSLFRPSVQPYMISWFKYDPQTEIAKLNCPVLLIQGSADIQVSMDDAKLLSKANPKAELVIIDQMNHIFRLVEGDAQANLATYNNATLPISEKMVEHISQFILKK